MNHRRRATLLLVSLVVLAALTACWPGRVYRYKTALSLLPTYPGATRTEQHVEGGLLHTVYQVRREITGHDVSYFYVYRLGSDWWRVIENVNDPDVVNPYFRRRDIEVRIKTEGLEGGGGQFAVDITDVIKEDSTIPACES